MSPLVRVSALCFALVAPTVAIAAPPANEAARKEEARKLFEAGRALDDKGDIPGAAQQFLASREMFKTRGNTLNAAIALRKLGRLNEALELLEAYLKDFDNLSAEDRAMVEGEITSTKQFLGELQINTSTEAFVIVDERVIGKTPLEAPLRVFAGAHRVRLQPIGAASRSVELEVHMIAQRTTTLNPNFDSIERAATLKIQASDVGVFDVLLDGTLVGRAPLAIATTAGNHVVVLRGEGGIGSVPTLAKLEDEQTLELSIATKTLDANVHVEVDPSDAILYVDEVPVGRGSWRGALPRGKHDFRAEAPGYVAHTVRANLANSEQSLRVELTTKSSEGEPQSGGDLGGFAELDLGLVLGVSGSSDMRAEHTGSLPIGVRTALRGGMTLHQRFELGAELSYLHLPEYTPDRPDTVSVVGRGVANGVSHDSLRWHSAGMGALFGVRLGPEKIPVTLRLGAGVLVGSMSDRRNGHFDAGSGIELAQAARVQSAALFFYLAPEVRVGYKINDHLSAGIGVRGTFAIDLTVPRWDARKPTVLERSGLAYWDAGAGRGSAGERLTGPLKVLVDPSLYVRYDF